MQKRRAQVGHMLSGMGTGVKLIENLANEIRARGGDPDLILHLMTRARFASNVSKVVGTIMECEWRMTADELRDMTWRLFRGSNLIRQLDARERDEIRNLNWYLALDDLGLPYKRFVTDPTDGGGPMIPPAIFEKLEELEMDYPLVIGDEVIVDWGTRSGQVLIPGTPIAPHLEDIDYIALAKVSLIDLGK